jgi:hypothetical protein
MDVKFEVCGFLEQTEGRVLFDEAMGAEEFV